MLTAILSSGFITEKRFNLGSQDEAITWIKQNNFKIVKRKESAYCLTVGELYGGCFMSKQYKCYYLI